MPDFKMSLEENAQSFFVEALQKAIEAENNKPQWKFALFSLIQAIELSLKERLRRDHWSLVFSNVDRLKNSVSIEQALGRLIEISKLQIDPKDIHAIKTAARWRNLVVHYEFEFTIQVIKTTFARLLGFYSSFSQKHLKKEIYPSLPPELVKEALQVKEYIKELIERAKQRIKEEAIDSEWVWGCPSCGCETFIVQDDICACYVCGVAEEVIECEDCGNSDFESEMTEVDEADGQGHPIGKYVCEDCASKYQDYPYDDYWDDPNLFP